MGRNKIDHLLSANLLRVEIEVGELFHEDNCPYSFIPPKRCPGQLLLVLMGAGPNPRNGSGVVTRVVKYDPLTLVSLSTLYFKVKTSVSGLHVSTLVTTCDF